MKKSTILRKDLLIFQPQSQNQNNSPTQTLHNSIVQMPAPCDEGAYGVLLFNYSKP